MNARALFIFIIVSTVLTGPVLAGRKTKEIKVPEATGSAIGGPDDSPAQVKQKAINAAKVDAMRKAGISEQINSYSDYFRSESNNKMEELFSSDVLSNIRGSVKDVEELFAKAGVSDDGHITYTVKISCTVIKYTTERDLTFDAKIEGIKMFYREGEGLEFTVTPTAECYIRAFMFFNDEAFVLLPNQVEKETLLKSGETKSFPYEAGSYELDAGGKISETNRLIFVFLKQDIPYFDKVAYQNIIDWVFTIPPDERLIESFTFDVINQE